MASSESSVTLSVAGYNQIKAENTRCNMLVDRIFEECISEDMQTLKVDEKLLDSLLHLCFPERYKKKLAYLRGLDTKMQMKGIREGKNDPDNM